MGTQKVTNSAEYDAGLRARGSLTVWLTAEAIEGWRAEARSGRGGQAKYSDLAIATALALRQTEGLSTVRGSAPDLAATRSRSGGARSLDSQPPLSSASAKVGSAVAHSLTKSPNLRVSAVVASRFIMRPSPGRSWRRAIGA